uniref:Uncharacterized protein n=1 Tax=Rhipicephalus microplus TaxID=6941 RepID=A0A6G5AEV1_RHIMP
MPYNAHRLHHNLGRSSKMGDAMLPLNPKSLSPINPKTRMACKCCPCCDFTKEYIFSFFTVLIFLNLSLQLTTHTVHQKQMFVNCQMVALTMSLQLLRFRWLLRVHC